MRHSTYTLRIESDGGTLAAEDVERLQTALQHAEDAVNDALSEGFYCKIDESGEGVNMSAVERLERMSDGS